MDAMEADESGSQGRMAVDDGEELTKQSKNEVNKAIEEYRFELEHEILPEMKKSFVVRKRFTLFDDLTFSMITCTENLYKVFERC